MTGVGVLFLGAMTSTTQLAGTTDPSHEVEWGALTLLRTCCRYRGTRIAQVDRGRLAIFPLPAAL